MAYKVGCALFMLMSSVLQLEWVRKRGRESVTQPFILSGKVIWAEWHSPFLLVENIKSKPQRSKQQQKQQQQQQR